MNISQLNGNKLVMGGEALLDTYYPVGRLYFSTQNVSPASFMGGSWEQIEDVFLMCAGSAYAAGTTGGEANVTLDISQMPNHNHPKQDLVRDSSYAETPLLPARTVFWDCLSQCNVTYSQQTVEHVGMFDGIYTGFAGNGASHNNLPPYLAVYCWERVA